MWFDSAMEHVHHHQTMTSGGDGTAQFDLGCRLFAFCLVPWAASSVRETLANGYMRAVSKHAPSMRQIGKANVRLAVKCNGAHPSSAASDRLRLKTQFDPGYCLLHFLAERSLQDPRA